MKIEVKNVSKSFKKNIVLNNVNMILESGNIYGFQGRNGSGKTVLLKLLCGLFSPDKGEILYDGKLLKRDVYKYNVGALIENPKFFADLSGYKNLRIIADIKNVITDEKINEVLDMLRLSEEKNKLYNKYSLGMKQKLGIAQAIMEDQSIIYLDEPFNGIEEVTVESIKKYLKNEKKKGKLIVISTHIKEDLESLCDKVYSFDAGEVKELKK